MITFSRSAFIGRVGWVIAIPPGLYTGTVASPVVQIPDGPTRVEFRVMTDGFGVGEIGYSAEVSTDAGVSWQPSGVGRFSGGPALTRAGTDGGPRRAVHRLPQGSGRRIRMSLLAGLLNVRSGLECRFV